jgi:hypothetical protein
LAVSSASVNISVQTCSITGLDALPLQVPGSVVSAVVPAGALATAGASISSIFFALAFDPHEGTPNSTGVVRLEFQSGGTPVAVANLSQLITFELPRTPNVPGASAQAAFWDAATQRYSTDGVVAIPNPAPLDLTLDWDATFDPSAKELNLAWIMSGPLLRGCRQILLNCSDPVQQLTQRVSLDPEESIGDPVVVCGNRTAGIMRVLVGHACVLWRVNASGCYWCGARMRMLLRRAYALFVLNAVSLPARDHTNRNATYQNFVGASCLPSNTTRMATTHLTEFMAAPAIHISVASPAQLAPSASALSRLRFLITVLAVLFAAMCAGAYLLSLRDAFDSRVLLKRILSPELGCNIVCHGGHRSGGSLDVALSPGAAGRRRGRRARQLRGAGGPDGHTRCAPCGRHTRILAAHIFASSDGPPRRAVCHVV